jgi:pimeloyl-ACP methyl ester carboxylesterase
MNGPGSHGSRTIVLGGPVHYVDFGGPADRPTVVLVQGVGGSHLDWDLLAPKLTAQFRVLAVDLPGFGMSGPTRRPATVPRNVEVLASFIRQVGRPPVVLVGNSMGGLIAVLLTARMPQLVRSLVLLDPALPAPARVARSPATAAVLALHALPGVGELLRRRRRRIGARASVRESLQLCGIDPDALPTELVERSVALADSRWDVAGTNRAFLSASRSLAWALARVRTYRAAMAAIAVPVLLVHGDRDQLVPVTAARAVRRGRPAWHYVELGGVGHLPQLQVPDELAGHILPWLDALPDATVTELGGEEPENPSGRPGS